MPRINRFSVIFIVLVLWVVSGSIVGCRTDVQPPDPGGSNDENSPIESENPPEIQPPDSEQCPESNGDSKAPNGDGDNDGDSEEDVRPTLEDTTRANDKGKTIVTNPDDLLVLVNKERNLPADYVPDDLVPVDVPFSFSGDDPRRLMRAEAAEALEALFEAAEEADISLVAASGYRAYETQKWIFNRNVERHGEEAANRFSARPGQSEHQTGLAMDVTSAEVDFQLVEAFAETPAGKWLDENAHAFGFIIRYPRGAEDITGYQYEPWHLRYVGPEHATVLYEAEITLEEYFADENDHS